jgi:hypothetical protein
MRGLKRHRSARILAAGHAFVQNLPRPLRDRHPRPRPSPAPHFLRRARRNDLTGRQVSAPACPGIAQRNNAVSGPENLNLSGVTRTSRPPGVGRRGLEPLTDLLAGSGDRAGSEHLPFGSAGCDLDAASPKPRRSPRLIPDPQDERQHWTTGGSGRGRGGIVRAHRSAAVSTVAHEPSVARDRHLFITAPHRYGVKVPDAGAERTGPGGWPGVWL